MEPNSFITHPIIFGNFMKMGANADDKMYEELNDFTKLKNVLQDVSINLSYCNDNTVEYH